MKKQVNPIIAAVILIAVIGGVLGLYTKGLLGRKKGQMGRPGGGGPQAMAPPPHGLRTVDVGTFAGWVRPGFVDGRGLQARFNGPSAIAAAPDGSLYVCDSRNHRLRRVTPDGATTTVAGSGPVDCLPGGFADGPADGARLFNPSGVCVGRDGAIYLADTGNHRIRILRSGRVSTLAGGPTERDALGFERGGFRDGPGPEARFCYPTALAVTASGDLCVGDLGNGAIRKVTPDGRVSTVARGAALKSPTGLALLAGGLRVADSEAAALLDVTGTAVKPVVLGQLDQPPRRPCAVCPVPGGGMVVADAEWHAIFGVTATGGCVLVAGFLPPQPGPGYRDGTGDVARFGRPCALAWAKGTLYVADFGNNCIRAIGGPGLDAAAWQASLESPIPFGSRPSLQGGPEGGGPGGPGGPGGGGRRGPPGAGGGAERGPGGPGGGRAGGRPGPGDNSGAGRPLGVRKG